MESYTKENKRAWTKVGVVAGVVDSTNATLRQQIQAFAKTGEVLPEGYSIRSPFQRQGKGRHDRKWEAEPGQNLLVSYLLSPAGLVQGQHFSLSVAVALAVRHTVADLLPDEEVCVKWPNDIIVHGQKLAGILIETIWQANRATHVIAGVGLNVNQTDFSGAANASSLALVAGKSFLVDMVWHKLTCQLQAMHQQLELAVGQGDFYPLFQEYHAHLCGIGKLISVSVPGESAKVKARLLGVLMSGKIRLEINGEEQQFDLDQIRLAPKALHG